MGLEGMGPGNETGFGAPSTNPPHLPGPSKAAVSPRQPQHQDGLGAPRLLTCFPLPGKPGILTGPRGSTEGQAVPRPRLLSNQAQRAWLHQGGCAPEVSYLGWSIKPSPFK